MKKSKIVLSTLAAAVFATSAGALVACGDGVELPEGLLGDKTYTITFDANGGTLKGDPTITIDANTDIKTVAIPTATRQDYTFQYWSLTKTGEKVEIKFDSFTDSTTVYARWKKNEEKPPVEEIPTNDEYTITFSAGAHGTLVGEAEVETKNGKATFPTVTAEEGWEFTGWADGAGKTVTADTVFTAAATVTAQYKQTTEEPNLTEEYTITFSAGLGGTIDGDTEVETDDGYAVFPYATPDDGYEFVGWFNEDDNEVNVYTKFDTDTTVTAIFKKIEVEELEETGYDVYADGTLIANLIENTNIDTETFGTRVKEWNGSDITFTTGQTLTFTVENKANVTVWLDGGKSDTLTLADGTITVKVGGTYDITVCQYQDQVSKGEYCVWIGKPGVVIPDPTPVDPEGTGYDVFADGTIIASLTENTNIDTETFGTRVKEWNASDITFTTGQTLTFTVENVANVTVWLDGGKSDTLTLENGVITVKAGGTYDITVCQYQDQVSKGEYCVWIGKPGVVIPDPTPVEPDPSELPTVSVKNGSVEIELEHNPANDTATYEFKLATGDKISLTKGDVITVLINGESPAPNFNLVNSHGATYSGNKITVTATGEFTFYLRYYENGNWWNVEINDGETDTLHTDHYYLVGAGYGFDGCVADGYVGETSGEIELTVGNDPVEFKLAKCTADGGISWDGSELGYSAVTVGKGYATAGNSGNVKLTAAGTYTIKLKNGKIEIYSDDVEEPEDNGGDVEIKAVTSEGVWLVGEGIPGGGWNDGVQFTENGSNNWTLTMYVTSTGWLKIRYGANDTSWVANADAGYTKYPGDNNFWVLESGTYTFTFDGEKVTVTPVASNNN